MVDFLSVDMKPSITSFNDIDDGGSVSFREQTEIQVAIIKGGATPKENYEIINTLNIFFEKIYSIESVESVVQSLDTELQNKKIIYILDACHLSDSNDIIENVKKLIGSVSSTKFGIVVIGRRDSINLYSQLRGFGVVYVTLESFSIVLKDYSINGFSSLININSSLNVCSSIVAIGTAGGVGTSVFCREFARYLSEVQRGQVCLVEKDICYSSQMMLNSISDQTQVMLSNISMPIRTQYLDSVTHELTKNLYLFAPRGDYPNSKDVSNELEKHILSAYRFVVSDYSIHAFSINKENINTYQQIILMTNGSIKSFKNTSEIISELDSLGIEQSKIKIIFNEGTVLTDFKANMDIYKRSFPQCHIYNLPKIKDMNIYLIDNHFAFKHHKNVSELLLSLYRIETTPIKKAGFSLKSIFKK